MRSALLISEVMGWCMRRPAHQASDESSQQRHGAERAGDGKCLANLAALDGIETRARRGRVG